ncbi:hypothetical protein, partial [Alicyclobacillus cellulosilyticus]|uniref:hypothetical protein n=1 Tax=Alicyclobacillus cellulosilyticus TaxID=1003997 RepID=UPI001E4656D1
MGAGVIREPDWPSLADGLSERLTAAMRRVDAAGRVTVVHTWPLPLTKETWLRLAAACFSPAHADEVRWLWRDREEDAWLVARGAAAVVTAGGPARFLSLRDQAEACLAHLDARAEDEVRWWCGGAFAADAPAGPWQGWPQAVAVLPQLCFAAGDHPRLTCAVSLAPGDDPRAAAGRVMAAAVRWWRAAHAR